MTLFRVLAMTVVVMLASGFATHAAEPSKPAFFEALYDVPVMPGLEEINDQAMLFDKPDGRIASVVAASSTLGVGDVSRFYVETLPQLGWEKVAENQYVRGDDRLTMEVSRKPPLTIVHFSLSPVIKHVGGH